MTDTKQTMRNTLRQHGLPEAWAEWVTRIEIRNGRPEQMFINVSGPEPPERTVTEYDEDDDGVPFERERTDDEMIAAWAEYGEAVKSWRAKYGDATHATVALAPSSTPYFTAVVTGNGATVKLSGGSDAGPWRVESTETTGGPRCVPVNPGEWITVLKEAVAESEHDYVPGFFAECTFVDGKPREPARKPPCYIAGPFRGKSHWDIAQNIRRAEAVALAAWRSGLFSWVYCPHLNTAHFQDAAPDDVWIEGHLEAMRAVHREGGVVLVVPEWEGSIGTLAEIEEASRLGMLVFEGARFWDDPKTALRAGRVRHCPSGYAACWGETNLSDYLTERAGREK